MASRTDNVSDPRVIADLLMARRGTAYFSRKLNELSDAELDNPSQLPGWSRRHVVAHVGYNARALTRLTEWAATGIENPMYASPRQRDEEITLGATLSPLALRNLSEHSIVHLNVEWRDLAEQSWNVDIRTAQGRIVPVSETVWMRSKEVWLHAIDLDSGGRYADLPDEFVDRLLREIVALWKKRGDPTPNVTLRPDDRDRMGIVLDEMAATRPHVLRGSAAQLLAWASGRNSQGLTLDGDGALPRAPRWI